MQDNDPEGMGPTFCLSAHTNLPGVDTFVTKLKLQLPKPRACGSWVPQRARLGFVQQDPAQPLPRRPIGGTHPCPCALSGSHRQHAALGYDQAQCWKPVRAL